MAKDKQRTPKLQTYSIDRTPGTRPYPFDMAMNHLTPMAKPVAPPRRTPQRPAQGPVRPGTNPGVPTINALARQIGATAIGEAPTALGVARESLGSALTPLAESRVPPYNPPSMPSPFNTPQWGARQYDYRTRRVTGESLAFPSLLDTMRDQGVTVPRQAAKQAPVPAIPPASAMTMPSNAERYAAGAKRFAAELAANPSVTPSSRTPVGLGGGPNMAGRPLNEVYAAYSAGAKDPMSPDIAAIRAGGDPNSARVGVVNRAGSYTPGTSSPFASVAASDALMNSGSMQRAREMQPRPRSGNPSGNGPGIDGQKSVVIGSVFGDEIRQGVPGVMDDFRYFNADRNEVAKQRGINPSQVTLDMMRPDSQAIYEYYRSQAYRDGKPRPTAGSPFAVRPAAPPAAQATPVSTGPSRVPPEVMEQSFASTPAVTTPTAQAPAAMTTTQAGTTQREPSLFQQASQARSDQRARSRQLQFARAQLPWNMRSSAAFNEDNTLDRAGTLSNYAARTGSPVAVGMAARASQEQMERDQFAAENAIEQQRLANETALQNYQMSPGYRGFLKEMQGIDSAPAPDNVDALIESGQNFMQLDDTARQYLVTELGNQMTNMTPAQRTAAANDIGAPTPWLLNRLSDLGRSPSWFTESSADRAARESEANAIRQILSARGVQAPDVRLRLPFFQENSAIMQYGTNPEKFKDFTVFD